MPEPDPIQEQADLDAYRPPADLDRLADPSSVALAEGFESASTYQRIVRACVRCAGPRHDPDAPCPSCGLTSRALVDELGMTSFVHRDPERAWWWLAKGRLQAQARIRRANKNAERLRNETS